MREGQEILIVIGKETYLITPNPFVEGMLELRAQSSDGGFDVIKNIKSLDELKELL